MSKMKAIAITKEKKVEIIEMNKPIPKDNEVLVKVEACGICTWDQRVYVGEKKVPFPLIGGHEVVGIISAVGSNVNPKLFAVGDKAAVRVVRSCHSCYYCRHGMTNMCIELNTLNLNGPEVYGMGGFAEYICVDKSNVWRLDESVSIKSTVLIEPLACVARSYEKGLPNVGDDIIVIGGGPMGLLHVLYGKLCGCRVTLSEPNEQRRKIAKSLGCDFTIDPINEDLETFVKKLTDDRGAEVVFDTTPIPALAEQAMKLVGPNGRCVMYSSMHPNTPIEISPNVFHSTEMVLTGSVSPSIESFDTAVNLISKKIIDPSILITRIYDYHDCTEAFEAAISQDTLRIAIKF